jgi:hypothetical protein
LKSGDQCGFVHDRTTSDVDKDSGRSKSFEHLLVDQIASGLTTHATGDEEVRVPSQFHKTWLKPIGDLRLLIAPVVSDGHVERLCTAGDGFADASQSEDAEALAINSFF